MCQILLFVIMLWILNKVWQWIAPRLEGGYKADEKKYWISFYYDWDEK